MMKRSRSTPKDIDQYIAGFPPRVRASLRRMRAAIRKAAPGAREATKYQIPTFTLNGNLVHFAAFKNHIGFYPAPRAIEQFKTELSAYDGAKGTVRFPLDKPLPLALPLGLWHERARGAAGADGEEKKR
jgi:uncharacterized protein YdhG (YjbR/CyaY superfamily)